MALWDGGGDLRLLNISQVAPHMAGTEKGEKAISVSLYDSNNKKKKTASQGGREGGAGVSLPPEGMVHQFSHFNICCFILYSSCQHNLPLWESSWFPTKCV